MPTSEKRLISRIRALARPNRALVAGVGDDSAILRLPPGREALITTDFSLEGVHFRREWHPPEFVGNRCLTRGLSDIAAMGGEPMAAFLSLALPGDLPQSWVNRFLKGLLSVANQFRTPLAGGDTAQSPNGILADIVVLGSAPKGKAILRSGARPGHRIFVTGQLGGAAAALDLMFRGNRLAPKDHPRHFHPVPRIAIGRYLREKKLASAMIDISDGFSTDLSHICEESGVGAEVHVNRIPRAFIGKADELVDLKHVLHGGDEYELIFTARPDRKIPPKIAGVVISEIGRIVRGRKVFAIDSNGRRSQLRAQGWQHFTRR